MQTFLPYPDFIQSAKVIDYRRLGKQRVEALQILNILRSLSVGWKNHPAVKMWRGHEDALSNYLSIIINEWEARGYRNNMFKPDIIKCQMPFWFGDDKFHASHRSNLLRKDAIWYGRFGWKEPNNLEYIWPKS